MKGNWEERFEASHGRWRGFLDAVVYAFLDCGDLNRGFARVVCEACEHEYLVAFSCSRRGICPPLVTPNEVRSLGASWAKKLWRKSVIVYGH